MNITFTCNGWFDIENNENDVIFGCATTDGDIVNIRIRKHEIRFLEDLSKHLSEVRDV